MNFQSFFLLFLGVYQVLRDLQVALSVLTQLQYLLSPVEVVSFAANLVCSTSQVLCDSDSAYDATRLSSYHCTLCLALANIQYISFLIPCLVTHYRVTVLLLFRLSHLPLTSLASFDFAITESLYSLSKHKY